MFHAATARNAPRDKRPQSRSDGALPGDEADRRQKRNDEMRRQEEDVGVADVVAEGEPSVAAKISDEQRGAPPVRARQVHKPAAAASGGTHPNCWRRSNAYIAAVRSPSTAGTSSTIVSRQSAFVTSNQNAAARRAKLAGGSIRSQRAYEDSTRTAARRARHIADRQRPGRAASAATASRRPRREQQEQREGRREQDHRQVVAEAERVDGEEQRQPAGASGCRGPAQQQQQRQRDQEQMCSA